MKNSWKLFEYKGTPVYLKYWFLALFLFLNPTWVVGIFSAIVVHELGHVWMANKLGYKTESVFINIFHGGAIIDNSYNNNDIHAMKIAIMGPLVNILLSILLFIPSILLSFLFSPLILDFILTMITINIMIGIFNLIPVYPLDGGRILRGFIGLYTTKERAKLWGSIISIILSVSVSILSLFIFKDYIISAFFIFLAYFSVVEIKHDDKNLPN